MKEKIKILFKGLFKKTPFYIPLRNRLSKWRHIWELRDWGRRSDKLPIPHLIKQRNLVRLARKYRLSTLVETGTYFGDMVEAMKGEFDLIYSIELNRDLYELATKRFSRAGNVRLKHGDSGQEIRNILCELDNPALFWLDAHYSAGITARSDKDTPILDELNHILHDSKPHVVVIDDARCFGSDSAYPSIEQLQEYVLAIRPDASIIVENDSIQIFPAAV